MHCAEPKHTHAYIHKWRMYLRTLVSCVWVGVWMCLCVGNQTSRQLGRWRRCSFFLSSPKPNSWHPTTSPFHSPYSNATHTRAYNPFLLLRSQNEGVIGRKREREREREGEKTNPATRYIQSVNNGRGNPTPHHSIPPHSTLHSILIGRTLLLVLSRSFARK